MISQSDFENYVKNMDNLDELHELKYIAEINSKITFEKIKDYVLQNPYETFDFIDNAINNFKHDLKTSFETKYEWLRFIEFKQTDHFSLIYKNYHSKIIKIIYFEKPIHEVEHIEIYVNDELKYSCEIDNILNHKNSKEIKDNLDIILFVKNFNT
jgi:hypothetical protein